MTYTICGVVVEARQIGWFMGLWANTTIHKGIIYSKQWWMLSLETQYEEYIHILQEKECGRKFRKLYVRYWFAKGFSYKKIPFELEATKNNNEQYILTRPPFNWRKYN